MVAALAALGYFVLIGGSAVGELLPGPRALSSLIAGILVAVYLWRAPLRADRVDVGVLLGVLVFAGAAVLSQFLRQSLDVILGVLAYAAAFFVARELLAEERWRAWFVNALIGLSLLLTLVTVARWLPQVTAQLSISEGVLPPLTLDLAAVPWGYRYDLALVIAVLYPAWWIGRPSPLRRVAAAVVGVLVMFVVLITGSRTVWVAVTISSAVMVGPMLQPTWHGASKLRLPIIAAVAVLGFVVLASGVGGAIVQRGLNVESLGLRTAMWGPLIDAWTTRPVAGFGPGSFPWLLQLTDYFDTNSLAPRHPDNAIIQLLAEGGLLGVLALLIVVVSVLPPILRGRSAAARWAIVAFMVACLGGNPSDFAFVLVIVIGWAAYAVPHEARMDQAPSVARPPIRIATVAAFGIMAAASVVVNVAAFSYEQARADVVAGRLSDARGALDAAVALDPGMALYVRQRGALAYITDDSDAAAADLERATALSPADDLAWRSLALAYLADGRDEEGQAALSRAVGLQRSDATNLLLSARVQGQQANTVEATNLLAEAVQSWPAIVGAPGWLELLPPSVTTEDVVDAAVARWEAGEPTPELASDQGLWLVAMADRPDLEDRAIAEAAIGPVLGEATIAVTRCDPAAWDVLNRASDSDRRNPLYEVLRQRARSLTSQSDERTDTGGTSGEDSAGTTLNPLDENGIFSADAWGYRRLPITWPASGEGLPSLMEGQTSWTLFPREAARAAQLDDRLSLCREAS